MHATFLVSSITNKNQWLQRVQKDAFIKQRISMNYRSRAALKLLQLHSKHKILKHGNSVLDLGCAPGGWTQVCAQTGCRVVGVDLLPVSAIPGSTLICGNIQAPNVYSQLAALGPFNVVLSDMAHSFTGHAQLDRDRVFDLCMFALHIASLHLKPGGNFVCKYLKGSDVHLLGNHFKSFKCAKPDASRKDSREEYFIGKGFLKRDNVPDPTMML